MRKMFTRREKKRIKKLWDEYRLTKQLKFGFWWLISEPEPPVWFIRYELGINEEGWESQGW